MRAPTPATLRAQANQLNTRVANIILLIVTSLFDLNLKVENNKKGDLRRLKCFHNGKNLRTYLKKRNPTEYAGFRNSSAYSLIVKSLSELVIQIYIIL